MVNNKYFAWYKKIVLSAQSRGTGVESHHIIPRSLGGSNEKSNRVLLTGREHLICHNLLFRCTENDDRRKMATALVLMGGRKMPSRKYEEAKVNGVVRKVEWKKENGAPVRTAFIPEERKKLRTYFLI